MLGKDVLVVDAIAHAFNLASDNIASREGDELRFGIHQMHMRYNQEDERVSPQVFIREQTPETLARTMFLESDTDIAVTHHVPMYAWFHEGSITRKQNEELVDRWPHRFLGYAGADPTQGVDVAIRQLDEQMAACPSLVGLKLYPMAIHPTRFYRLDDKDIYPLYERCMHHGIKTVAVHKALPLGRVPLEYLAISDMDKVAYDFPDLNFEIVHAGLAWVDETAIAMAAMPNIYVNLEFTTGWLGTGPAGRFYEVLAAFLSWGGLEKIFYSSGALQTHPQAILKKFWEMKFPDAVLEKYDDVRQLTDVDKAKMLGGNYLAMHGLDTQKIKAAIADDEFARERAANGGALLQPWTTLRQQAEAEGLDPVFAEAAQ